MKRSKLLDSIVEVVVCAFVFALILMLASKLFDSFEISSFGYAFVAALIISLLNVTVKPILIWITLPITIFTVGIFYPFINIFVLKITGLILGSHFVVEGWFIPFFIAIFISVMKVISDVLITKPVLKGRKRR